MDLQILNTGGREGGREEERGKEGGGREGEVKIQQELSIQSPALSG